MTPQPLATDCFRSDFCRHVGSAVVPQRTRADPASDGAAGRDRSFDAGDYSPGNLVPTDAMSIHGVRKTRLRAPITPATETLYNAEELPNTNPGCSRGPLTSNTATILRRSGDIPYPITLEPTHFLFSC